MNRTLRYVIPALVALVSVVALAATSLHSHADGLHNDCPLCITSVQQAVPTILFSGITLFLVVLSTVSVTVVRHDRIWHSDLPATRAPPA